MDTSTIICPFCKNIVPADSYFCPQCGKEIKRKPSSTSIGKQILVYFISFFLPPFGLGYAWKYIRHGDKKSKIIGIIAIVLTIASIIISLWMMEQILKPIQDQMNELNNLGF